jgi:hypothetical protein
MLNEPKKVRPSHGSGEVGEESSLEIGGGVGGAKGRGQEKRGAVCHAPDTVQGFNAADSTVVDSVSLDETVRPC